MPKAELEKHDVPQMANFCLHLIMPRLIAACRRKPKTFMSWTLNSKLGFASQAIQEVLEDPKNGVMKRVINNSAYVNTGGDYPYQALATKISNVI